MRTRTNAFLALALALALAACGDGDDAPADAGLRDGAAADSSIFGAALPLPPEIPWLETGLEVAPPAPPVFAPCPEGFRETELGCEPWPKSGMATCTGSSAHFPGEPGCRAVGGACPTGPFAAGLPDDGSVIFVRRGATGGDGTRASPYGAIADAMAVASPGQRIALARATYDEPVRFAEGVAIEGACADETILTSSSTLATVHTDASGAELRAVTIRGGNGPGVIVTGTTASIELGGVVVEDTKGLGLLADSGARLVARDLIVRATRSRDDGYFGRALLSQEGASAEVERAVFAGNREAGASTGLSGATATLRRVAILDTDSAGEGLSGFGVWVFDTGTMHLEAVVIERAKTAGIDVGTATLEGDVVIVRDTRGATGTGYRGQGLFANDAGTARVTRGTFVRNRREHVGIYGDSTVTLADCALDDTLGLEADLSEGRAVLAAEGARVELRRVRITRANSTGIVAYDSGTEVVAEDIAISDTRPEAASGFGGRGIEALDGASVDLTRAAFDRNRDSGIFCAGSTVRLTDVTVRDTSDADGQGGYGVVIAPNSARTANSTGTAERVLLERNRFAGIIIDSSMLTLTDAVVRETRDGAGGIDASGFGLDVREGATLEASRVLLEDGSVAGIGVTGATLVLRDAVVRRTQSRESNGLFGRGLIGQTGSMLTLERVVLEENHEVGLFLAGSGVTASLTDLVVRDMLPQTNSGQSGRGLEIDTGAHATVVRGLVERAREVAVMISSGSSLDATDFVILDTMGNDCTGTPCPDGAFGNGLSSLRDASATLRSFVVDGADLCGVEIAAGGGLDLERGTITHAAIGACVHDSGYDIMRLTMDVAYRDNGANIESVDFAVPEPAPSFGDVAP